MAELQSDDTAQNGANVDIFDVNSPFSAKERISRIVEIKRVVETSGKAILCVYHQLFYQCGA